MSKLGKPKLLSLLVGMYIATHQLPVLAADEKEDSSALNMEEVIVTGTPRGVSKMNTSYGVTSASAEELAEDAPLSTADVLKIAPGVFSESTAGETGANVFVRGLPQAGDADFLSTNYDGMPISHEQTLSFFETATLFRLDETIDRVEVVRGGPNVVLSNGNPGVTFNFIPKKGDADPEGVAKISLSDYGMRRVDMQYSGPLSDKWNMSVGGFYRTADGIRDPGFPADQGGQFSVYLSREMDDGELNLYVKKLEDKNLFSDVIPLAGTLENPKDYPGCEAGTCSLFSAETRLAELTVGPGGKTLKVDFADGRGVDLSTFGGNLAKEFSNGWHLDNRFSFMSGDVFTNGFFGAGSPVTQAQFLDSQISAANANAALVDEVGMATTGAYTLASTGMAYTGGANVLTNGAWHVNKAMNSFTNDLKVSYETDRNFFTVGLYLADWSSDDYWSLGNNMLVTAENNPRLLNLTLDNGVAVTTNGLTSDAFFLLNANYNGSQTALYLYDEFQVTDDFKFDGGVRVITVDSTGSIGNTGSSGPNGYDGDITTLRDNNASYWNGSSTEASPINDDQETSYTAGFNYNLTENQGVFARYSLGYRFPSFDNQRQGQLDNQEVTQLEIGYKLDTDTFGVYLTGFLAQLENSPFQNFVQVAPGVFNSLVTGYDSESTGLEFDIVWQPTDELSLAFTGTYLSAEYVDFVQVNSDGSSVDYSGNTVQRQPEIQYQLKPSYDFGFGSIYANIAYVDERFVNFANTLKIGAYTKIDLGTRIDISDDFSVALAVDNLTNEIGLTQANPATNNTITDLGAMGRPIFGRSVRLTGTYKF